METIVFYLAIGDDSVWERNPQTRLEARNWQEACAIGLALSRIHHKEVRLSNSAGYRNQGHYLVDDHRLWAEKSIHVTQIK